MAVTQVQGQTIRFGTGQNGRLMETGILTWTSDTAIVELATKLSKIESVQFTRIGPVNPDDWGLLSVDETVVNDGINVSGSAFTVVRQENTAAGTLTGESHYYQLIGY